jgi:hypothetical protein
VGRCDLPGSGRSSGIPIGFEREKTEISLILAYDPGFGNTKVASDQGVHILQLTVARPHEIGMAAKGLETQARPQTVTLSSGLSSVVGAIVLGELLRSALAAKVAAVHWPADPVTANVVGFYKWGCRVHR